MRIVQLRHLQQGRRVAVVSEPNLMLIRQFENIFQLCNSALANSQPLVQFIQEHLTKETLPYDEIYAGQSPWQLLPAIDHPTDPRHCMVTGTGLTHKASADNRQKMNAAQAANQLTDSMRMYQWGVEGGRPPKGQVGTQPEWFYKGNGSVLKAHNEPLLIPNYANDGGEEPEIAGIYLNDHEGNPRRIGFAIGNEFSDHVMEKKNYLYLAPSKIRTCSIGPELVITDSFADISGHVTVLRNGKVLWQKSVKTGEENMAYTLENLEYHHFKYTNHRIPFDLHVHYFGTGAFSFGDGLRLEDGDIMQVEWQNMGRPLRNPLKADKSQERMFSVKAL